jgi:hypothetical protein
MDKQMRCQCGRLRTVALDKHFRTVLHCENCDVVEQSEPVRQREDAQAALQNA